jgi:hypothetical protein
VFSLKEYHLLMERTDFQYVATELVKHYGLKSKVKFGSGNYGDYDFDNDVIKLKRNFSKVKDFIITVLHEIHHATQVKKYGKKRFIKKYMQAGDMAAFDGFNRYDNNKWEKRAENWAKDEYNRRWKNKF